MNSDQPKPSLFEIRLGMPLSFSEGGVSPPMGELEKAKFDDARQVGATIKAYRKAVESLLSSKYSHLRSYTPAWLAEPCQATIICCDDGIIIRYDKAERESANVRIAKSKGSLKELAPMFSDFLIHFPGDEIPYDPGPNGIKFELAKYDSTTGEVQPINSFRPILIAKSTYPPGITILPPPHRLPCLVSVANEFEFQMGGVIMPEANTPTQQVHKTREFVARSKMQLAVGWRAIEIYPTFDIAYWRPEFAPVWAETDIMAAVARQQISHAYYSALDPNAGARKAYRELLNEFQAVLDGPEEPAHQFLKKHPELLNPPHVAVWSKLPLGERVTDFVFRDAAGEYMLVEIESPLRGLFRKDGQQRQELTHAFNQILDWRVYIENNLTTVQNLGLTGISANPKSLIVIGRSTDISEENRTKLTTMQGQIPNLRILTYDDVIKNAKAVAENLFGPLDFVGENSEIYFLSDSGPAKS